jgi:hypothetical protein
MRIVQLIVLSAALALPGLSTTAQTTGSSSSTPLPQAPSPQPPRDEGNDSYFARAGIFCGSGASTTPGTTKPTVGCGAGATLVPLPIFLEAGVMGPQARRSSVSGYISVDGSIPLASQEKKYLPMALIGYSRLFETGHALDYGLALAISRPGKDRYSDRNLRIELRDYCTFANPTQHNVMLRVGWMLEEPD